MSATSPSAERVYLQLTQPACTLPNGQVREAFSLALRPGLSCLRGGEGRGKSTLLAAIAQHGGAPSLASTPPFPGSPACISASLAFPALGASTLISHEQPGDPVLDERTVHEHLAARRACFAGWQPETEAALIGAWALTEHLHKPLFMLSSGSRRKVGLVASAASGAHITLLDTPFAALDARSGRLLCEVLAEAALGHDRAWLLADYALPAGLAQVPLAASVNLGD